MSHGMPFDYPTTLISNNKPTAVFPGEGVHLFVSLSNVGNRNRNPFCCGANVAVSPVAANRANVGDDQRLTNAHSRSVQAPYHRRHMTSTIAPEPCPSTNGD
ncbi:hypothetical protein J6590_032954 [Homalodisca vitripennis]|nr:hypothetical protein J6590_032954 [Homalodisca vitripennis]